MMNVNIEVASYFDLYFQLLGWYLNNRAWELLLDTGLFVLPMAFAVIGMFLKVREQGADEGNKGALLLNWLENYFYVTIPILYATCVPLFHVNFHILPNQLDETCGVKRIEDPRKTAIGQAFDSHNMTLLNDQSVRMPIWWAFTALIGNGFTNGMVNALPCRPNIGQLAKEVNTQYIRNPLLRNEVNEFLEACYYPARSQLIEQATRNNIRLNASTNSDINWIGSKVLIDGGFYSLSNRHAKLPKPGWNYDPQRDAGLGNNPSAGGFPRCDDWWNAPSKGLRARLLEEFDLHSIKPRSIYRYGFKNKNPGTTDDDADNALLRAGVASTEKIAQSELVYQQFGNSLDLDSNSGFLNGLKKTADIVGEAVGMVFTKLTAKISRPGHKSMIQTAPMIQAMGAFVLILLIPIIIVVGQYKIKPVILIMFMQLGITFCTFIWRMGEWLEGWTFEALENSVTKGANTDLTVGFSNTSVDSGFQLVIGLMTQGFPIMMFAALGYSGIQVGNFLDKALSSGTNATKQAADNGVKSAQSMITKSITKRGGS